jgi:sugar lactone lactonase YvrE
MARKSVLSLIRTTASVVLLAGGAASGCSCGDDSGEKQLAGPLGDGQITESHVAASDEVHPVLFDAAPNADGSVFFFTGVGPDGPGVFSAPSAGGDITTVAAGDPFIAPFGIALSTDGKTLYIADTGAESEALDTDGGKILVLPAEGGAVSELAGTDDTSPRGLHVVEESGVDQIYYTGVSPEGVAGLYKISASGGDRTVVAEGGPFHDPCGVTVIPKSGDIYVVDTVASDQALASILHVKDGAIDEFLPHLQVGYPAGIASSPDGKALLLSALDPAKEVSVALRVDILSKEPTLFAIISETPLVEPGGLHRARDADIYSFVDSTSPTPAVYLLE